MISVYHSLSVFSDAETQIKRLTDWKHQILLVGGCNTASASFAVSINDASDWFFLGLARTIEAFSINGNMVWQGIVNEVEITIGNRAIKVGPWKDISNNVFVAFAERSYAGLNTTAGRYLATEWASDLESIDRYGLLQEAISGGQGELPEMNTLRDKSLARLSFPKVSENPSATPGTVMCTLRCIGYHQIFDRQIYNKPYFEDATYSLTEKVRDVWSANQNFSPASLHHVALIDNLDQVSHQVNVLEDKDRSGWNVIKDSVSKIPQDIMVGTFPGSRFVLRDVSVGEGYGSEEYIRESGGSRIKLAGQYIDESELLPGRRMALSDFRIPVDYLITSVDYTLSTGRASTNQYEKSLGQAMSKTMLGGA